MIGDSLIIEHDILGRRRTKSARECHGSWNPVMDKVGRWSRVVWCGGTGREGRREGGTGGGAVVHAVLLVYEEAGMAEG